MITKKINQYLLAENICISERSIHTERLENRNEDMNDMELF